MDFEEKQTLIETIYRCFFVWGQVGAGFSGKEMFLYEKGVGNIPPHIGSISEIFMRESQNYLII